MRSITLSKTELELRKQNFLGLHVVGHNVWLCIYDVPYILYKKFHLTLKNSLVFESPLRIVLDLSPGHNAQ